MKSFIQLGAWCLTKLKGDQAPCFVGPYLDPYCLQKVKLRSAVCFKNWKESFFIWSRTYREHCIYVAIHKSRQTVFHVFLLPASQSKQWLFDLFLFTTQTTNVPWGLYTNRDEHDLLYNNFQTLIYSFSEHKPQTFLEDFIQNRAEHDWYQRCRICRSERNAKPPPLIQFT